MECPQTTTHNCLISKMTDSTQNIKPLIIGILCDETKYADILYYLSKFIKTQTKCPQIEFILFGFKPEHNGVKKLVHNLNFKYIKPISIIHYYKQLSQLGINLLFIPLKDNSFNRTSEIYQKYIDAGLNKIPVLAPNLNPYSMIIKNEGNGLLYEPNGKKDLPKLFYDIYLKSIKTLNENEISTLQQIGENAYNDVMTNYHLTTENLKYIAENIYN